MFKYLLRPLGYFLIVSLVLLTIAAILGFSQHASISLGDAPLAYKVGDDGPYAFYENGALKVSYIRGSRDEGFHVETQEYAVNDAVAAEVYFPLDDSRFNIKISPLSDNENALYQTSSPILAVSDLEGNYKAFRDFLIANKVISADLQWIYGDSHLVLVGDMVDRGFSTTQLLWFIYKLEQEAQQAGGKVHYIVGNHEIKNMQGNVRSAANKYIAIAGFLRKSSSDLLGKDAFLGQWLATKNTIERINGYLFVHGGIHPDIVKNDISIAEINSLNREYYRHMYYPGLADEKTSLVISTQTGPAWYRGYFKEDNTEETLRNTLMFYQAKSVIVGHTIQFNVNSQYKNKLFAIDVKHPNDYRTSLPFKSSEGLLINNDKFYRVLDDGEKIEL
ncbi:metallophosphoesterase [Alteromonas antoniana]|uniref:metallophosphoesterase n=1 Tax=Alteromonas antoniana TaxID=2803813 RepID=UPI001C47B973|nr:metallophosphoesterase [Alteromonas antoniana]